MFDFFYDGRKTFQMSLLSAGIILFIYAIYNGVNYPGLAGENPIFLEFPSTMSMIAYYGLLKPVCLFLFAITTFLLGLKFSIDETGKFNLFINIVLSFIGIYFFVFFILHTAYPLTKEVNNLNSFVALIFIILGYKFIIPASCFEDSNDGFNLILYGSMYVIMFFVLPILMVARASFIPFDPLLTGTVCLISAVAGRIAYPAYLDLSYRHDIEHRKYLVQQQNVCPACKRPII